MDLTGFAREFVKDSSDGLLNVLVPHATAGLALMELATVFSFLESRPD